MLAQALERALRVQRDPMGVDHVLEQAAVQHRGLLAEPARAEVAHYRLIGSGRARKDRLHDHLAVVAKCPSAGHSPVRDALGHRVEQSPAGAKPLRGRVAAAAGWFRHRDQATAASHAARGNRERAAQASAHTRRVGSSWSTTSRRRHRPDLKGSPPLRRHCVARTRSSTATAGRSHAPPTLVRSNKRFGDQGGTSRA
jgi:hypothetical protein